MKKSLPTTIACQLEHGQKYDAIIFVDSGEEVLLRCKTMRAIAPMLCKGLRPGRTRNLLLTQTTRGIKIEGIKA